MHHLALKTLPAAAALVAASLAQADDIFAVDTRAGGGAVSAGMFGAGFALRLARAEAKALGVKIPRLKQTGGDQPGDKR